MMHDNYQFFCPIKPETSSEDLIDHSKLNLILKNFKLLDFKITNENFFISINFLNSESKALKLSSKEYNFLVISCLSTQLRTFVDSLCFDFMCMQPSFLLQHLFTFVYNGHNNQLHQIKKFHDFVPNLECSLIEQFFQSEAKVNQILDLNEEEKCRYLFQKVLAFLPPYLYTEFFHLKYFDDGVKYPSIEKMHTFISTHSQHSQLLDKCYFSPQAETKISPCTMSPQE